MKEGWTYKKLGEVAMLKNGFAFKSSLFKETGTPIVRISNIQDDRITTDFVYFDKNDYRETLDKYEVYEGDILIAMSGATTGKVGINTNSEVLYLNQRVGKFVPQKELHSLFLFYYLKRNANFSLSVAQGMAQPNLSTQQINNFIIPIPPLAEQERIVAELDLLSSIIEKKKAQLKELDQLAQSIFYDMFGDPITNEKGWEIEKFEDVCSSMTKGPFGSDIKKSLYVPKSEDTYKVYIQINAIEKDATLGTYYISKEYFDNKMFKFEVKPNDYIITCDGTLGKFLRLPQSIEKGIISASLLRLTLNEKINYKYFEHIWDCYILQQQTKDIRNTALKHLPSASKMGKTLIPLPPLPLQQEFASKVEAIERQKSLIQQSIDEVQTMFDGRMDYWFG